MRIETVYSPSNTQIEYKGILGNKPNGDNARYCISFSCGGVLFSFATNQLHSHLFGDNLPLLFNFYRDLGGALNELQPGLTLPLPDEDPNFVDALKVIHEADRLRMEAK